MQKTQYIWQNGALKPWEEAETHVLTHALHYGSGVFEGERFYNTDRGLSIFHLQDHTRRLLKSAAVFGFKIPYDEDQINQATIDLIKAVGSESGGYIRPLIYSGYGEMGLISIDQNPVDVIIAAWPWGKYLSDNPIRVKISSYIRIHPQSTITTAKITGHYSNSILAGREVKKLGYDEALLLDYRGFIAEGPGENFFIVKDGKLITPKLDNVLAGITRDSIMIIARDEGIEVIEKDITIDEAYTADEAFFTGTAAEVTIIGSLDDHEYRSGDGTIGDKLKKIYADVVLGKVEKYQHWLTYLDEVK